MLCSRKSTVSATPQIIKCLSEKPLVGEGVAFAHIRIRSVRFFGWAPKEIGRVDHVPHGQPGQSYKASEGIMVCHDSLFPSLPGAKYP